jgi:hypothetical protein
MGDVYRMKTVRAVKAHACEENGCPIAAGDDYVRHSGVLEGYGFSVKVCLRCQAMRNEGWDIFEWCEETAPQFGDLRTGLKEEGIADPEAWLDERLARQAAIAAGRRAVAAYQGLAYGR